MLTDRNRRAAYDQVYWARQGGDDYEDPAEHAWNSYDSQDHQWEEEPGPQGSGSDYSWRSDQERQASYRSSRGSGYRWNGSRSHGEWNNRRSWGSGAWWEENPGETQADEPATRETRQQARHSRFVLLALLCYLVDRIRPDPDESQRTLPWPSWAWQRTGLIAGIPLAALVFW